MFESIFSLEEPRAKASPSLALEKDWLTHGETSHSRILPLLIAIGPSGLFSRTSPESFPHGPAMSRRVIWKKDKNGNLQKRVVSDASWRDFSNSGMGSPTECLTLNTCEHVALSEPSLSDEGVCSLSEILEAGDVPQQYYLSAKACRGILRRADKRGKELPRQLALALQAVAASEQTSTATDGSFHKDTAGKPRRRLTPHSEAS